MSNVSFTIHTPLQRTLHPTGPIPDTYCIITLACNINPTIPQNIIQKFPAQFFGTDTSTAIDQCGILFYSHSPCTLRRHINITVLVNGPTHCLLCTISPSNIPNWTYHHYLTCLALLSNWLSPILWTNYLHHTDPTHRLLGMQLMTVLW